MVVLECVEYLLTPYIVNSNLVNELLTQGLGGQAVTEDGARDSYKCWRLCRVIQLGGEVETGARERPKR